MVSEEMLYLMKNKEKLEREHEGKYVAIYKDKLVAIGRTIHEIYEKVQNTNIKNPLVTYIPRKGEEALLIWWKYLTSLKFFIKIIIHKEFL